MYILIIPFGTIMICAAYYLYLGCKNESLSKDLKKDVKEVGSIKGEDKGETRIERIFNKINHTKIIDTLNNFDDYRTASTELDKKLINFIKKEM